MSYMNIQLYPLVNKKNKVVWYLGDSGHNCSKITSDYTPMPDKQIIAAIRDRMKAMMVAELNEDSSQKAYNMCYEHNRFSMNQIENEFVRAVNSSNGKKKKLKMQ